MDELNSQNPRSIQNLFSGIAKRYDLANSVLSFGIHHSWKKTLIRKSKIQPGQSVLDCATGTGDLAFLFEKALQGKGEVTGTDFCEPMLELARKKAQIQNSKVKFEVADVLNLPYSDNQFDRASISFGIRNVQDPKKCLSELARVTRPGGKVLVLEFGQPENSGMRVLFGIYSNQILPRIGGLISGNREAYQYLQTSSAAFPCGKAFLDIAQSTGLFSGLSYSTFQGGIAYLYVLER